MRLTLVTGGKPVLPPRRLKAVAAALEAHLEKKGSLEAFVGMISQGEMRRLNHDWRGKNRPANILSWPQFEGRKLAAAVRKSNPRRPLYIGDVVLCPDIVRREAKRQKKPARHHFTHLVVHGVLHLLGYDHVTPRKAARMEKLEKKILQSLGIADPYAGMGQDSPTT